MVVYDAVAVATIFRPIILGQSDETVGMIGWRLWGKIAKHLFTIVNEAIRPWKRQKGIMEIGIRPSNLFGMARPAYVKANTRSCGGEVKAFSLCINDDRTWIASRYVNPLARITLAPATTTRDGGVSRCLLHGGIVATRRSRQASRCVIPI